MKSQLVEYFDLKQEKFQNIYKFSLFELMSRKGSQGFDDTLKNSENVVSYLIGNVFKQNKIEFYQNLDIKALEFLVAANFQNKYLSHQDKVFVVGLIKQHPLILSIAFDREKFNFMLIFGFLRNRSTLEMNRLRAFEQIFLPFCKKYPQKFLGMLSRHNDIKEILLRKLYLKNVLKIVYTAVFCLHNTQTLNLDNLTSEIITAITQSIFDFAYDTLEKQKYFDPTQVVINFNDFLAEIVLNLSTVEVPFLLKMVEIMNRQYIQEILSKFDSERTNKEKNQSSQTLIDILLNLLRIFQTIKLSMNRQFSEQDLKHLKKIDKILKDNCTYLASKMNHFIYILLEENNEKMSFSSGELIQKVTMVRYRILELIQKILSINELQPLKIRFSSFDFFPVIEYYLQNYKWNNIVHNLLLKIAELLLSQDYKHFKERYIKNPDQYHENVLGNIIVSFRNRKFMFLSSIRMTNSGNQCSIYELSKMLVNQMKEQKDLATLIEHFKLWKEFMEVDLKRFETQNFTLKNKPDNQRTLSPPQRKRRSFDFSRSPAEMKEPSTRSLQTFEQILLKLKEEDKWSPKKEPQKFSKKAIQSSLSRFDSMGLLQSQIQQ